MYLRRGIVALLFYIAPILLYAQQATRILTLPDALKLSLNRHELIKAKNNYLQASAENITAAKRDGLPDVNLSVQQAYGTINGFNGLTSGLPGNVTITSGPITNTQNWNAAFGSIYSSNINWNLFSFGLQRAHVAEAKGFYNQNAADLEQEKFLQQIRAAGAYFNLLSAQRLHYAMTVNLLRVSDLRKVILARTENGLNPGVDSSIANAELAKARIAVTDAIAYEQSQARDLAIQLGIDTQQFDLDTSFVNRVPAQLPKPDSGNIAHHPTLQYFADRVKTSELTASYISKTKMPRLLLFGTLQDRGSGFGSNYGTNLQDYSGNYLNGVTPSRANYLIGIGLTWNITDLARVSSRVKSQHFYSDALMNEYHYQENTLNNQLLEANNQLINALNKYREAPIQLKAANDAYEQKKMLYSNGLATIVDITQALYNLNRAETDRDVASNAVWQSLLYVAGSSGNLPLFLNQL